MDVRYNFAFQVSREELDALASYVCAFRARAERACLEHLAELAAADRGWRASLSASVAACVAPGAAGAHVLLFGNGLIFATRAHVGAWGERSRAVRWAHACSWMGVVARLGASAVHHTAPRPMACVRLSARISG
jgi:hypothetical protein